MINKISGLLLMLGLAFAAPLKAEFTEVNNQQLQALLESNVTIVDLRREDEWRATGVVENSQLLTFFDQIGRFDAQAWLQKLSTVTSPDKPLIVICQTGVRSKLVGYWLSSQLGFAEIYNVTDGIESWRQAGKPVISVVE